VDGVGCANARVIGDKASIATTNAMPLKTCTIFDMVAPLKHAKLILAGIGASQV
jgi:hypothetical protein